MLAFALLGLLGIGLLVDLLADDEDVQETSDVNTLVSESGTTLGDERVDDVAGGDGENSIFGKGGNDFLTGGAGDDRLFGGDDDDHLLGESGDDFIRGGADDDTLWGGEGADTLIGDTGNDIIYGMDLLDEDAFIESSRFRPASFIPFDFGKDTAEADTLSGGAGNDVLFVGANDIANTGNGSDIVLTGLWMKAGESATITDFKQGTERVSDLLCMSNSVHASQTKEHDDNDYHQGTFRRAAERRRERERFARRTWVDEGTQSPPYGTDAGRRVD
jgi:Ca2+-binding RTX toxin-like protein